jgi:tetratricopeptide (TPR) repeat protein
MNLAFLAEREGRTAEALAHYETAVEIQPKDGLAQFHLGRLLFERRDFPGTEAHFLKALAPEQAGRPEMLAAIAAVYSRGGNPEYGQEFARAAKQQAAAFDLTDFEAAIDSVFATPRSGR